MSELGKPFLKSDPKKIFKKTENRRQNAACEQSEQKTTSEKWKFQTKNWA